MNQIIPWLLYELDTFIVELFKFINYYTLRDRLPFYATLNYIMGRNSESRLYKEIATAFLTIAFAVSVVNIFYFVVEGSNDRLFGFAWGPIAPIQYTVQIFSLYYLGWKATKNINYSVALAYNGASATGFLYEMPFWYFSIKPEVHLIHVSQRYIFLFSYQMIAIGVFILLLRKKGMIFTKKDLAFFVGVFGITSLMASQMYVWHTAEIVRIPMMLFSLYLVSKLRGVQNES